MRAACCFRSYLLASAVLLAAAQASADDADRFRELVRQATAAFGEGNFQRAIELCNEAYALKPNPRLLYNRARAHEVLGLRLKAIEDYTLYLERDANAEDREIITGRIKALRAQLAEQERLAGERAQSAGDSVAARAHYRRYLELAPGAPDRREIEERLTAMARAPRQALPSVRDTEEEAERGPGKGPWLTISVGGVALTGGGVLAALSRQAYDDARQASSGREAASRRADGDRLTTFANVGLIVGGVLAVSGVTWLLLSSSRGQKRAKVSAPNGLPLGQRRSRALDAEGARWVGGAAELPSAVARGGLPGACGAW